MAARITLALAITLVAAVPTASRPSSYADAETVSEAVGMMMVTLASNAKLASECSTRAPEMASELAVDLKTWEQAESANFRKARYHWATMAAQEPKINELLAVAEAAAVNNLDLMAKASLAQSPVGDSLLGRYCRRHFSDLAAGVWRVRTPQAYILLDRVADPASDQQ